MPPYGRFKKTTMRPGPPVASMPRGAASLRNLSVQSNPLVCGALRRRQRGEAFATGARPLVVELVLIH